MLAVPKEFAGLMATFALCLPSGCGTMSKSCWSGPSWPPATGPFRCVAGHGLGPCEVFSPYHRVFNRDVWSSLAGLVCCSSSGVPPRSQRAASDGIGRHHGAAPGRKSTPRASTATPCALTAIWSKPAGSLVVPDAVGPHSLGQARVGLAVPDRAGALRALPPGARPAAQEADRPGAPDAPGGAALGARAHTGACHR